jgi:hypothetical protein
MSRILAVAALAAEHLIVGNDEELFFVDGKPVVTHSPGKDTVSIIDIRDHAKSRIVATLPLENPSSVRRAKPDRVLGTRKTGRVFRAAEQSIFGNERVRNADADLAIVADRASGECGFRAFAR